VRVRVRRSAPGGARSCSGSIESWTAGVDRAVVRVHTPDGGTFVPGGDRRRGVKPNLLVIAQGTPTCGGSGGGSGLVLALVGRVNAVWGSGLRRGI
jgi:hypothetical protein